MQTYEEVNNDIIKLSTLPKAVEVLSKVMAAYFQRIWVRQFSLHSHVRVRIHLLTSSSIIIIIIIFIYLFIYLFIYFLFFFIVAAIFGVVEKMRRKPRVFKPVSLESGKDVGLQSSEAYEL